MEKKIIFFEKVIDNKIILYIFWTSFISVLVLSFTTPFSQVQSFNFSPPP